MSDTEGGDVVQCAISNDYNGLIGLRVSAIFVILVGSLFGAVFPVFAKRHRSINLGSWVYFFAKYFGSGVIIATAFIHLLAPANEALGNPCLTGPITEYSWVEGIALMTIFVMFFVELLVIRRSPFSGGHTHSHDSSHQDTTTTPNQLEKGVQDASLQDERSSSHSATAHTPGKDHLSHQRTHIDPDSSDRGHGVEDYAAQLTAIFILEFGVIFHSIFIGLTLAVSGEEFKTLYVVLVFHQTFEGLGLGSRLAAAPWPPNKRWTPYILGVGYGISTPIAIAIGLAVRDTYAPGSAASLIANGVFDSISAGILIYTGLVELMAHEFMFSEVMRKAKLSVVLGAFGYMCLGAGLMALLGKWA